MYRLQSREYREKGTGTGTSPSLQTTPKMQAYPGARKTLKQKKTLQSTALVQLTYKYTEPKNRPPTPTPL